VTSGTKRDRQRISRSVNGSEGAPNKRSLAAYRDGQAWQEATCRYGCVPDGGQQSLLVEEAQISVSSALEGIHGGTNLNNLGTPLKSNIDHVLDRQSAPWHLPYHCRGIVTPVHSAVRCQALNDVASRSQQNVGCDSAPGFGGELRGTP
jgi:hypothetical protein